jgi:nucleosome binding factor SPN SPT16 subunit
MKLFRTLTGVNSLDEAVEPDSVIDGTFRDWAKDRRDSERKTRERAKKALAAREKREAIEKLRAEDDTRTAHELADMGISFEPEE